MKSYLIGYDLNKSGQDYKTLIAEIKEFPAYWHHLDSTWIVKSDLSAKEIRDKLTPFIDGNDELLVAKFSGEAAWIGFSERASKWLKDHL